MVLVAAGVAGVSMLSGGSAEEPSASVSISLGDNYFEPRSVVLKAGQKTKVALYSARQAKHNLWSSGPDAESGNGDDIRSKDLAGGDLATIEVKFDQPGNYGFSYTFHAGQNGEFVVGP